MRCLNVSSQTWMKKKIWRHLVRNCTIWFTPNTKRLLENSQVSWPAGQIVTFFLTLKIWPIKTKVSTPACVFQVCCWSCQVPSWVRCCRTRPRWPQPWRKPSEPYSWHRSPGTAMGRGLPDLISLHHPEQAGLKQYVGPHFWGWCNPSRVFRCRRAY